MLPTTGSVQTEVGNSPQGKAGYPCDEWEARMTCDVCDGIYFLCTLNGIPLNVNLYDQRSFHSTFTAISPSPSVLTITKVDGSPPQAPLLTHGYFPLDSGTASFECYLTSDENLFADATIYVHEPPAQIFRGGSRS